MGHPLRSLRPNFWYGFGLILVVAVSLRLWGLTEPSLTADEAVTAGFARLPWGGILFDRIDNHPVLSFLIQKAWWQIAPGTEYLRVPSMATGVATVAVAMLMVRDLVSARAALIAGVLFALATGHIHYSQEARMYVFLVFGLTMASWGALGLYRPGGLITRAYTILYILGGAVSIHSHLIGLIGMAMISLPTLMASFEMGEERLTYWKRWLSANLVLLVLALPWLIQIPEAMGTFPGYEEAGYRLFDIQWFFRNATGFPGFGGVWTVFELVMYLTVVYGIFVSWRQSRLEVAALIIGLVFVYPMIILILETRTPILANRVFLPSIIGVVMGAGIALSSLRTFGLGAATVISIAASLSALNLVSSHNTFENYGGAFEVVDENGFDDAPVITCNHFWAAAIWETRRDAELLLYRRYSVFRYPGASYWEAARHGMSNLRGAEAATLARFIGEEHWIKGGLSEALQGENRISFIRPFCPGKLDVQLESALAEIGFEREARFLVEDNAPASPILEGPQTLVDFYVR